MKNKLKIFLDIDDVVAAWQESYCKEFNRKPAKSWDENREEMNYHLSLLKKKDFFGLIFQLNIFLIFNQVVI